jgi:hypothetical protein
MTEAIERQFFLQGSYVKCSIPCAVRRLRGVEVFDHTVWVRPKGLVQEEPNPYLPVCVAPDSPLRKPKEGPMRPDLETECLICIYAAIASGRPDALEALQHCGACEVTGTSGDVFSRMGADSLLPIAV